MDKMLSFQNLPFYINPTAFSIGPFSVSWYALMYLAAFLTVYALVRYRIKKGEGNIITSNQLVDFFLYAAWGLILGARLGYVLFYDFSYYLNNPIEIISPFNPATHEFIGIYGMSYHGGLIGVFLAAWLFAKKRNIDFWDLADFISPAIPAGYFFGRIGNFINGELWGRATEKSWGMYFPDDKMGMLRHPSQLYEAFFEGIVLFLALWSWRNKKVFKNRMLSLYLIGYAVFRFFIEFFREPDEQIGFIFEYFTLGQFFSLLMMIFGFFLLLKKGKKRV